MGRHPLVEPSVLKKLHKKGLTARELAAELDVTEATVYNHLRTLKLTPNTIASPLDGKDLLKLYQKDVTVKDLMEHLSASEKSITRALLQAINKKWEDKRIKLPKPRDIREWRIAQTLLEDRRLSPLEVRESTNLPLTQVTRYMKRIK